MSASYVNAMKFPEVMLARFSHLKIVPTAPSMSGSLWTSSGSYLSSGVMTEKSRAAVLRELAIQPFRRAIHNNVSLFRSLVGEANDISSPVFIENLRMNSNKANLLNLPIFSPDHQQAFLGFR